MQQQLNSNKAFALWEDIDEGNIVGSQPDYGDIWNFEGVDSKSRRLRWTPMHFCVYGWAKESMNVGRNKSAALALGQSTLTREGQIICSIVEFDCTLITLLDCFIRCVRFQEKAEEIWRKF